MPRKPQQARARATRDAIVDAAFLCVARHGLAGTSTRQLIETAGVSPGSFYEYFANKDAVFEAMFQRFVGDALLMIEPLKTAVVQMSIEELVRTLLANFESFLRKDDELYLRCARHAMQVDSRQHLDPAYQLLADLVIQHALNNPETRNVRDLSTFAYIFVNGGVALIVRHLADPNPPISFEQLGNGLANMVGHYVRQENRLAAEAQGERRKS